MWFHRKDQPKHQRFVARSIISHTLEKIGKPLNNRYITFTRIDGLVGTAFSPSAEGWWYDCRSGQVKD